MAKKRNKPTEKESLKDVSAAKPQALAKWELTEEEKERLARYKQQANRKSVKLTIIENGKDKGKLTFKDLDDPMLPVKLSEAFGTANHDMQLYLLKQIQQIFDGACSVDGNNIEVVVNGSEISMGILSSIKPQNELEAMLAVQMIGVHNMAINTMGMAMHGGQTLQGKESNCNLATKMLRTFIAQMETLQKIRTGCQQKMIVEHVHVNEGGQAIVGTVNQGVGKKDKP